MISIFLRTEDRELRMRASTNYRRRINDLKHIRWGKKKNLILRYLIIEPSLKIFIREFDSEVLSPFAQWNVEL